MGPLCDPLPPCPPIAPGLLTVTVDLSFAPCDEPFATDFATDSATGVGPPVVGTAAEMGNA